MIYGLYLSAQGAEVQSARQDVIANNLANASTSSFKRDLAIFHAHPPADGPPGPPQPGSNRWDQHSGGVSLAGIATDYSDGSQLETGRELDVALSGPGFLRVSRGDEQFLTRDGRFAVDKQQRLILADQNLLVSGIDAIPNEASQIEIAEDGTVSAIVGDGQRSILGRLDLVQPASLGDLQKLGSNLYLAQGPLAPAGAEVKVKQGYVEGSGTDSVAEMMQLIDASRAFESNINMIRFQDEALGQLLQSVGRQ